MTTEKTTAQLITEFKERGGKITHVASSMPKGNTRPKSAMNEYKSR